MCKSAADPIICHVKVGRLGKVSMIWEMHGTIQRFHNYT